ncbi:uncharacterized protein K452DRAFT_44899 [Aplosporella prunicola CBS 121167]|uniref:Uncharacterized protein n=1 Tax=Aplosporella prunicola CBS 121167 TaxID=1176127 RepID=A0A6A6BF12_9PEZI|nr:uncharacterized protein K452DRAFT_44899 [Aplosporella prunicola CBS 121167]KAF2141071.1 hypothetical protein K452DRAFT_44899 [Aplosporella prunicola CBS 121167]
MNELPESRPPPVARCREELAGCCSVRPLQQTAAAACLLASCRARPRRRYAAPSPIRAGGMQQAPRIKPAGSGPGSVVWFGVVSGVSGLSVKRSAVNTLVAWYIAQQASKRACVCVRAVKRSRAEQSRAEQYLGTVQQQPEQKTRRTNQAEPHRRLARARPEEKFLSRSLLEGKKEQLACPHSRESNRIGGGAGGARAVLAQWQLGGDLGGVEIAARLMDWRDSRVHAWAGSGVWGGGGAIVIGTGRLINPSATHPRCMFTTFADTVCTLARYDYARTRNRSESRWLAS